MKPHLLPPRSLVCLALTTLILAGLIISFIASGRSYVVWATAGATSALAMLVGIPVGLVVLVIELRTAHRTATVWPAILLAFSALPMGLLFLGSALLGI